MISLALNSPLSSSLLQATYNHNIYPGLIVIIYLTFFHSQQLQILDINLLGRKKLKQAWERNRNSDLANSFIQKFPFEEILLIWLYIHSKSRIVQIVKLLNLQNHAKSKTMGIAKLCKVPNYAKCITIQCTKLCTLYMEDCKIM